MRQIERVRRARSQLVMGRHPFYGCLALGLKLEASAAIGTMATDGKRLVVNEEWTSTLSDDELRGVIVHEVMHVAYGHSFRRGRRDHRGWNIAGDYAINRDLLSQGFTLPSSQLYDPRFDGMSADQVYATLAREAEERKSQQQQQQRSDGGRQQSKGGQGPAPQDEPEDDDDSQVGGQSPGAKPGDDPDDQPDDEAQGDSGDEPDDGEHDRGDEPDNEPAGGKGDEPDDPEDEPHEPIHGSGDADEDGDDEDDEDDEGDEGDDEGDGDPGGCGEVLYAADPNDHVAIEELEASWKAQVLAAAAIARAQGLLPAEIERLVTEQRTSAKQNWRVLLRRFVTQSTSKDYVWSRPNRRFIGGGLYLPSLQSNAVDHALVAIDTSGSVIDHQAQSAFSDELQDLLDTGAVDKVTVVYCDTVIHGEPEEYNRGDEVQLRRPGGGGTNFAPVTTWAADQQAACLIYFTDLLCRSFGEDPGLPVLWARWGAYGHPDIPFGEVIEIDPHS